MQQHDLIDRGHDVLTEWDVCTIMLIIKLVIMINLGGSESLILIFNQTVLLMVSGVRACVCVRVCVRVCVYIWTDGCVANKSE